MAKKPTIKQIEAEVKLLQSAKPRVRKESHFHDRNDLAIQAQIDVLLEDLTEDDIYAKWDGNQHLIDNAIEARNWLDGDVDDNYKSPSSEWVELFEN